MWRIYSQNKNGIRIRTTVEKLLESLSIANVSTPMVESGIGKVTYKTDKKIVAAVKGTFREDGRMTFGGLFRSLLIKRKAFEHEKEIRLIHLDWGHELPDSNLFKYEIDPHDLISQVMIDPRISYDEFKNIQKKIENKTGYKGDIKRSLLYKLPEPVVIYLEKNLTIDER